MLEYLPSRVSFLWRDWWNLLSKSMKGTWKVEVYWIAIFSVIPNPRNSPSFSLPPPKFSDCLSLFWVENNKIAISSQAILEICTIKNSIAIRLLLTGHSPKTPWGLVATLIICFFPILLLLSQKSLLAFMIHFFPSLFFLPPLWLLFHSILFSERQKKPKIPSNHHTRWKRWKNDEKIYREKLRDEMFFFFSLFFDSKKYFGS